MKPFCDFAVNGENFGGAELNWRTSGLDAFGSCRSAEVMAKGRRKTKAMMKSVLEVVFCESNFTRTTMRAKWLEVFMTRKQLPVDE